MMRLIEEFEDRYGQVVIDSPLALSVTDTPTLGGSWTVTEMFRLDVFS